MRRDDIERILWIILIVVLLAIIVIYGGRLESCMEEFDFFQCVKIVR